MADSITSDTRGTSNRGLPSDKTIVDPATAQSEEVVRLRSLAPQTYRRPDGTPPSQQDFERFSQLHSAMEEERHVWRFRRPDGTYYDTSWKGIGTQSTARASASIMGHELIGEVQQDRWQEYPGAEKPLSLPRLVKAPATKPKQPPPRKRVTIEERGTGRGGPTAADRSTSAPEPIRAPIGKSPHQRPPVLPPPEETGWEVFVDYMKHHFARTTMMESMPLISTGFNRVGNVLEKLGLGGVGRAYKVIAEIADAAQLIYELVNELNQADALEKGARELVKRTKPVKKIADKLIRKKFPNMPEPIRNEVSKQLEDLFEKYFSDPQIKKGKKALQEVDDNKDLNRSLYEELRRMQKKLTIPLAPVSSPASLP